MSSTYYRRSQKNKEAELRLIIQNGSLQHIRLAALNIASKVKPIDLLDRSIELNMDTNIQSFSARLLACFPTASVPSTRRDAFQDSVAIVFKDPNLSPYEKIGKTLEAFKVLKKELGYPKVKHIEVQKTCTTHLIALAWQSLHIEAPAPIPPIGAAPLQNIIRPTTFDFNFRSKKDPSEYIQFMAQSEEFKASLKKFTPWQLIAGHKGLGETLKDTQKQEHLFSAYLNMLDPSNFDRQRIQLLLEKTLDQSLSIYDFNKKERRLMLPWIREMQRRVIENTPTKVDGAGELGLSMIRKTLKTKGPQHLMECKLIPPEARLPILDLFDKEIGETYRVAESLLAGDDSHMQAMLEMKWQQKIGTALPYIESDIVSIFA